MMAYNSPIPLEVSIVILFVGMSAFALSYLYMARRQKSMKTLIEEKKREMDTLNAEIADLRNQEHSLSDTVHRDERILENLPAGAYFIRSNAEGDVSCEYVSHKWCEMLNIPRETVLKDSSAMMKPWLPEDREDLVLRGEEALCRGMPLRWEGRAVVRGETKWMRVESNVQKLPNGDAHWFGTLSDITEWKTNERIREQLLREAENSRKALLSVLEDERRGQAERMRLAAAIEQSTETIIITDTEGVIQYVNPVFTTVTGYTREEVLGKKTNILKSDKQDHEFYQNLWTTIKSGKVWNGRLINRKKDGTLFTERMTISPVHDHDGNIINYVSLRRDITRELEIERKLDEAHKMELVGRMAGGIAHDFNNLLQPIIGFTELAQHPDCTPEQRAEFLSEVRSASDSAKGLIQQLITFSRQKSLSKQELDLDKILERMKKLIQRMLSDDITLEINCNSQNAVIKADLAQIEQIIINLAINARDAISGNGEIEIRTSVLHTTKEDILEQPNAKAGNFLKLTVSDTGNGMSDEVKERIFEPFFTTKRARKGSGLGLSTVYGIVNQHEGWIDVDSTPGKGTDIHVYLPTFSTLIHHDESPEADQSEHALTGDGERILLVEDDKSVRSLMKSILTRNGYEVRAAESTEEALEIYEEHEGVFDLIFSDVILPDKSGFDLVEELLGKNDKLRVVMVSGYTDERTRWADMRREGWRFLHKPVSHNELLKAVYEVLHNNK